MYLRGMWRVSGRCEESPRTLCLHIDDRMHVWKCEQGGKRGLDVLGLTSLRNPA